MIRAGVVGLALASLIIGACGSADDGAAASATVATTTGPQAPTAPGEVTLPSATTTATAAPSGTGIAGCADVVDVEAVAEGAGYTFHVTVASADTGWDKYADAWTVSTPSGTVLGERVLTHPHVEEQPFTRSLTGVMLPDGTAEVVVAARDSVLGYCGMTVTVPVAGEA